MAGLYSDRGRAAESRVPLDLGGEASCGHPRTGHRTGTAAVLLFGLIGAVPAEAATVAASPADTAWVAMATALVLLMSVPGLALFYGGLVRTKNTVSMLMQVTAVVCVVALAWMLYGYSIAFTGGTWTSYFGGLWKAGLRGVTPDSVVATRGLGAGIPEYGFVAFQMMFACVTPALIVGAFAERVRFSAALMFAVLWLTFVYAPIAHMAWYAPGADALAEAARAVQQAVGPEARRKAEAALALLRSDAGLFVQWGALDFAGGAVVHINAGVAGLVTAVVIGRRAGYGTQSMAPHNLAMTLTGATLMWVGWLGFNAGSALKADGIAALALLNTLIAGAAGAMSWAMVEHFKGARPSLLGLSTGLLAGLVVVTPAAGYVAPLAAVVLGLVAAPLSYLFCTTIKQRYHYDDALDVFGVHCACGVLGMLAVGVLASPALGGTGIVEYISRPGAGTVEPFEIGSHLWAQFKAVAVTLAWSGYASARILTLVDMAVGTRLSEEAESSGLDAVDHGERVYNT